MIGVKEQGGIEDFKLSQEFGYHHHHHLQVSSLFL
jgi:hypothetical protein